MSTSSEPCLGRTDSSFLERRYTWGLGAWLAAPAVFLYAHFFSQPAVSGLWGCLRNEADLLTLKMHVLADALSPPQVLLAWSGGPSSSSMVWQVLEVRLHHPLGLSLFPQPTLQSFWLTLDRTPHPGWDTHRISHVYSAGVQSRSPVQGPRLHPCLAAFVRT